MYLLSPFEVAELLCRVKLKYDNERGMDTSVINSDINVETPSPIALERFFENCSRNYSEEFSTNILTPNSSNVKKDKPGPGASKSPVLLYDMKLSYQNGHPLLMSKEEIFNLLKYLSIENQLNQLYSPLRKNQFTEKQLLFEGGCWSLFYIGTDNVLQNRINQAILVFLPFGKLKIKAVNQEYSGFYETYGNDEFYLLMQLKTIPAKKKDLHILTYCGANKPQIMLGQFHNVEQNITAGTIVLEPIDGTYETLTPKYIENDSDDYMQINELIRRYFSEEKQHRLFTPVEKVSYAGFEKYLNSLK